MKTLLLLLLLCLTAQAYDPLTKGIEGTRLELTKRDEKRSREIPLRVYLPAEK
jgi:hypothetical protein